MGDWLIGNESYLAVRDVSTVDYTSVGYQFGALASATHTTSGYQYHTWDPGADNLDETQTPIRSEGAQGARGATDSRQGLLDNCGGDFTAPQMNFGNYFWPVLFKHTFGTQVSSTVVTTGTASTQPLKYYRFFPATTSSSFTANYLEVLQSRPRLAGAANQATRYVGARVVSLNMESEVGGPIKVRPTIVARNTFSTTRTVASTIEAVKAKQAFFASPEVTVDISGTAYGVRSWNLEMTNGFFGDGGTDDHVHGSRFREDISWNEDLQISGSLEFRAPQAAIHALQRNHGAFNLTIAATANVKFTGSSTFYPAMKLYSPKLYLNDDTTNFGGHGRIAHGIDFYAEKLPSGSGDFAQGALQVELWNIAIEPA